MSPIGMSMWIDSLGGDISVNLRTSSCPAHLIGKLWAFKPAAPLVLDIQNRYLGNWNSLAYDDPMVVWFKANGVKRLKSPHNYTTWLFPDEQTKVMWLLTNDESYG